MSRGRSNIALKRERSLLADMENNPEQMDVNVAVPNEMTSDVSLQSLMADAEAKYASGDYEGSLMAYSEALVIYPDSLEILDGLTDAQTALAQNLLKPKPAPRNSESVRVTQQVSAPPSHTYGTPQSYGTTSPAPQRAAYSSPTPPQPYDTQLQSNTNPDPISRSPSPASNPPTSASLPPQKANSGAPTPAPRARTYALPVSPPQGEKSPDRASSGPPQASPPSFQASNTYLVVPDGNNSRLSNKPPVKGQIVLSRPITPADKDVDSRVMIRTQQAKIEGDMRQELWDRVQARSEELIEDIRNIPNHDMTSEEKETHLARVYNSLGQADLAIGNMNKALEDHTLALHIAETYNLFDVKSEAEGAIGRIHMSLGREPSAEWEETIKIDKEIDSFVVEMPITDNLTRTKTIMSTEDNPTMVDVAMPATVETMEGEIKNVDELMTEAEARSAAGDHEGALMLYSAAQTKDPNNKEVTDRLNKAELALQESMAGALTARAIAEKEEQLKKGWAAAGEVEDAPVYMDPAAESGTLSLFAERIFAKIEDDLTKGDAEAAQNNCEMFLEKFDTMKDDVTLGERFTFLATVHNQLGRTLAALGDNNKAMIEHNAALQIAERNGLDNVRIQSLDLIARIELAEGQVSQAISAWTQCLPLCLTDAEKSQVYHKVALSEMQQKNYEEAKLNADKAAMAAMKAKKADLLVNAHVVMSMAMATNGDRVGAMKVYKKALKAEKKLKDQEIREDIQRRIEALENGDLDEATVAPVEALMAVAVYLNSQPPTVVTSRASWWTSETPSVVPSLKSSRAPSPTLAPSRILSDTVSLLQMYLLFTLPEF